MIIKQNLLPIGKQGSSDLRKETIGVTIHDTAQYRKGTGAWWHSEYLKKATREGSWHYAVDDKEVVQSIEDDRTAWHAKKGNDKTIGIEICVNVDGDLAKATDNAARLAAILLTRYKLAPEGTLFQHNYWTGKNCPGELRRGNPCTWQQFCSRVSYYHQVKDLEG